MTYPERRVEVLRKGEVAINEQALQLPPYLSIVPSSAEPEASLAHFTKVVRRQKYFLMAFVGIAMLAAIVVQLTIPKLYEATTIVKVDRHAAGGVIGQEAAQVSSVDDMDQIITTQMEIAQSDPVLRPIAEKYNLLKEEKQLSGFTSAQIEAKKAAPIELRRLKITRPPNTYLIKITYRAHDSKLAADVANAIADSLSKHANDTENHSFAEVSEVIARDMVQLRAKMQASAQSLAAFQKELNMVDPEQRTTVLTARLTQLNTEYTNAQSERLRREAILKGVASGNTLASAQAADSDIQNNLLNDAVQRRNAMRQQFASIRAFYGENHSEYRKAKQQLEETETEVAQMMANAADRARVEYTQAQRRESGLKMLMDQTKGEVDDLNLRELQYQQLKSEAENDKKLYEDLQTRTQEADINRQFQNATVQIAAAALPPDEQIFPRLIIDLPLAFVLSGLLGICGVVLVNAVDTTFSDPQEVATQLKVDVLATIPAAKSLPMAYSLETALAANNASRRFVEGAAKYIEAVRALRSVVYLAAMDRPIRTLLVTSSNSGEGKSTISAHLAMVCAQVGKRVLLIDADLRRPVQHRQFGVECKTGLSDILVDPSSSIEQATLKVKDTDLYLMPAGPVSRRAADIINIGFCEVLERVRNDFDLIIVDSPPVLGLSDSQELAGMVDGVVVVTKAGETTGRAVSETLTRMNRARANVLGLVLNQVKTGEAQGYDYSYNYYCSSHPESEKASA